MKLKYLALATFIIFTFNIFAQPPFWPIASIKTVSGTSTQLPLYTTQLVYQLDIPQNTTLQFVRIKIPSSVIQQQYQYCKTYDSYITNNIRDIKQCVHAYPAIVFLYNPNTRSTSAHDVTYAIVPVSYDSTTGLPDTFDIFLNNRIGAQAPGTYYLYVYYPSPYYLTFDTIFDPYTMPQCVDPSYATSKDFNGGWCSDTGGFGSFYNAEAFPGYVYPYAQSLYYHGGSYGCVGVGGVNLTRYFNVKFDPQYPVLIGFMSTGFTPAFGGYITVGNPSTGQIQTIYVPAGNVLYDLRTLELGQGLNPYQWNLIINVKHGAKSQGVCYDVDFYPTGIYLQYVPAT
ncbi:MAG: hypothetical protein ACP5GJ_02505 [Nanopusillaceae archaeon]